MVSCIYCGEKTILYINGEPTCLDCAKLIEANVHPLVSRQIERAAESPKRGSKVKAAGHGA